MNPQFSIVRRLLIYTFFVFLSACQSKTGSLGTVNNQPSNEIPSASEDFERKRKNLERKKRSLDLEKKWLGMRAKLVIAEKELNQAMLAKLSIEAGIARFEKLNGQFPSDEGFIVDRERISWQARLHSRNQDVVNARAQLNLYNREFNELRFEISGLGFSAPTGPVVK